MRPTTLLASSVLLLLAAPLASAGPIGLLPVSEHEEGCSNDSWNWYDSDYDAGTGAWSQMQSMGWREGCSSRDSVSASVLANGDEVAGVYASDATWNGSGWSWWSYSEWDADSGTGYSSGGTYNGSGEGTYAHAVAMGTRAYAQKSCEEGAFSYDHSYGEGDVDSNSGTYGYGAWGGTYCRTGATSFTPAGMVSAGRTEECAEGYGQTTYYQGRNDNGSWTTDYDDRYSSSNVCGSRTGVESEQASVTHEDGESCYQNARYAGYDGSAYGKCEDGDRVRASAAGESVSAANGNRCENASTWSSSSWTYDDRCDRGPRVETGYATVHHGSYSWRSSRCDGDGCTWDEGGAAGTIVRAGGFEVVGPWLLP